MHRKTAKEMWISVVIIIGKTDYKLDVGMWGRSKCKVIKTYINLWQRSHNWRSCVSNIVLEVSLWEQVRLRWSRWKAHAASRSCLTFSTATSEDKAATHRFKLGISSLRICFDGWQRGRRVIYGKLEVWVLYPHIDDGHPSGLWRKRSRTNLHAVNKDRMCEWHPIRVSETEIRL